MIRLADLVKVERRFGLSARVESDLNGTPPLSGYVMQASVGKALQTMTEGILEAKRHTFTWTGPYGGGKSCAALLVASLVAGSKPQKTLAEEIVGPETAESFRKAFPDRKPGWKAIALTGRRAPLLADLAEACASALDWDKKTTAKASTDDRTLIALLEAEAAKRGGLLIILDELGKSFEHAAAHGGDIHLLQDLAERADRSGGRMVVVGILHQSFDQYADRLGRGAREDWVKVQGRYQNIPFVAQADEVAALLAHAIESEPPTSAADLAGQVAQAVALRRPVDADALAVTLTQVWPLHPITALLLGPVSRQRFAQNERSVFGFLSSSEPHGFKAHLEATKSDADHVWFCPDQLWDYLVANLGSALSVGPDGNRMSLAFEAIERAALRSALHARLVKTAALIEFFRNGSGLAVSDDFLVMSAPDAGADEVAAALTDLTERAILIRQPRLGGYALFAGSDFDLEGAISRQIDVLSAEALFDLPTRLGVGPIAAKRHYFETGALRTFDVVVLLAQDNQNDIASWAEAAADRLVKRPRKAAGQLILLMPDPRTFETSADEAAAALSLALEVRQAVAGVAVSSEVARVGDHVAELHALERIEQSHPQLEGDRIARREVSARRVQITDAARRELTAALAGASWWSLGKRAADLDHKPMSVVASDVAEHAFSSAPIIHSELLCRDRPSTSAMAGLRGLAHAMVKTPDQAGLGIDGYPAERGLYLTLLEPLGLHRQERKTGDWAFRDPGSSKAGKSLCAAWSLLGTPKRRSLEDVYETWAGRPYGLKRGVMPVIALSYILAHRNSLAVYLDGLYQATIDDIFVDRMMQSPKSVELQKIERAAKDQQLIARLSDLLSTPAASIDPDALPVASALFRRYQALPQWAQRTATLTPRAKQVRDIVLKATDPEALLFTDLAEALSDVPEPAAAIAAALQEAERAFPAMLDAFTEAMAEQLGVENGRFDELGPRALAAAGITADLRLDAFAARAGAFATGEGDIEGLASLLVHRPPRSWTDREHSQALFELARLAVRFREAESFAQLKGREPTTRAISVMVGVDPKDRPLSQAFAVTEEELCQADELAAEFILRIRSQAGRSTIGMAALARAVEQLSRENAPEPELADAE